MKLLWNDESSMLCVVLESKTEGKQLVEVTAAAIAGKALNKRSAAYKLAKMIDDELPVF